MKEEKNLPPREILDQSFHDLQDKITRITVEEEAEMVQCEQEEKTNE